jgi:2-polyprenyl-6-methoxyphenol hydroxylase-like FAD-dependent oxidoreductase
VPELLRRCRTVTRVFFDAVVQIQLPQWSKGGVALLGDAAWCLSPLAGQGASMAIAGAYVLAEELDRTADVEDAVARYESRLRPAIERQQRAGRRLAKWFVPESDFGIAVRDVITRASVWPGVASILRNRMTAQSIFAREKAPAHA